MKKTHTILVVLVLGLFVAALLTGCGSAVKANPAADNSSEIEGTPKSAPSANNQTAGSGKTGDQPVSNNENGQFGQGGKGTDAGEPKQDNGVQGKLITQNYPSEIEKYIQENKAKETQQAMNINNKTYIAMTMGEKNTGGYSIKLKDLSLKDSTLMVYVEYIKPGKDDLVSMAMTYPYLVIETDKIYEGHYMIAYDIQK